MGQGLQERVRKTFVATSRCYSKITFCASPRDHKNWQIGLNYLSANVFSVIEAGHHAKQALLLVRAKCLVL